ncbi:alpha/beta fold hydrolase [Roseibium sp. RKSG952]|uniref:alpha/beta fold hydrolase n=1 Tax=Roseibium sp. RKSG952 TaxID=2529384 RepID=UPI0012BBD161|nr:alpha/beta hydrolase [Roseibium sp. RKSG952]MTH97729.1 alpha/beta hydrolase [Roseibium sp. RKSG952]
MEAMAKDPDPIPEGAAEPFTWKSRDGLTLSGRIWRPDPSAPKDAVPVLCLPGLSRNTRDFRPIAEFLQDHGHLVVALDYRGRGDSDWDSNWQNYALTVEDGDIDDAISKLGLDRFAVLGTSRGGLHAMMMAQRYDKRRLAAIILNDVGPHVEMRGVRRIAATLGRIMRFPDKHSHARQMKRLMHHQFPKLSDTDWVKLAEQLGSHKNEGWELDYDPNLGHTLASLDDGVPLPDFWPLYEHLVGIPVLILHGQNSDILTHDCCCRMLEENPKARLHTIEGQGHAPLLWDAPTQECIEHFLKEAR